MKSINELIRKKPWVAWVLFFSTLLLVFIIGLFASSIMERRMEALISYTLPVNLSDYEARNVIWGKFFPREYDSWKKTSEMDFKTKYNGNMRRDALEEDPSLVILWAGYAFAKDYYSPRGHQYSIEDIRNTLRTGSPMTDIDGPQPNTCWSCKGPDVPRLMSKKGPEDFYKGMWASKGSEIVNPVGCADCHEPKTMNLRLSRPALIEAFERQNIKEAEFSHQEKRSLVCAQCHVEYYFKGKDKYLTFPWDKGSSVDEIEKYYDEIEFSDWTHALSRTPMIKAQHPDYELYKLGIHGQRRVACADCHMPYKSEGGVKYTNHQIVSPLKNIDTTCQVCHRESEEELKKNVYERQDKVYELRSIAQEILVKAHYEAKKAWEVGASDEDMKSILKLIRHAGWRWDFAVASHGASFHAPLEVSRILSTSIQKAQEARRLLTKVLFKYGFTGEVEVPDISTKQKAQEVIGFDIEKAKKEKNEFLQKIVPEWDKKAKEREGI